MIPYQSANSVNFDLAKPFSPFSDDIFPCSYIGIGDGMFPKKEEKKNISNNYFATIQNNVPPFPYVEIESSPDESKRGNSSSCRYNFNKPFDQLDIDMSTSAADRIGDMPFSQTDEKPKIDKSIESTKFFLDDSFMANSYYNSNANLKNGIKDSKNEDGDDENRKQFKFSSSNFTQKKNNFLANNCDININQNLRSVDNISNSEQSQLLSIVPLFSDEQEDPAISQTNNDRLLIGMGNQSINNSNQINISCNNDNLDNKNKCNIYINKYKDFNDVHFNDSNNNTYKINYISTNEINTNEIDTNEINTNEIDTNEIGTNEIDTNEIDTNEIDTNEIDTNEIGTNEIGTNEIGTNEIGTNEIDTNEIDTNEIGTNEIDTNKIDTNDINTNDMNTNDINTNDMNTNDMNTNDINTNGTNINNNRKKKNNQNNNSLKYNYLNNNYLSNNYLNNNYLDNNYLNNNLNCNFVTNNFMNNNNCLNNSYIKKKNTNKDYTNQNYMNKDFLDNNIANNDFIDNSFINNDVINNNINEYNEIKPKRKYIRKNKGKKDGNNTADRSDDSTDNNLGNSENGNRKESPKINLIIKDTIIAHGDENNQKRNIVVEVPLKITDQNRREHIARSKAPIAEVIQAVIGTHLTQKELIYMRKHIFQNILPAVTRDETRNKLKNLEFLEKNREIVIPFLTNPTTIAMIVQLVYGKRKPNIRLEMINKLLK